MTIIEKLNKNDVIEEDECLKLRKLKPEDRADFFRVLKQVSPVPEIFNLDGFEDLLWKETLSSNTEMTLAIEKKEPAYVGECMVKNPEPGILELGVDVGTEYQNRGIGTRAMRLLITGIRQRCPGCRLIARIYSDNVKSIHIIRKLGGMKIAEEPGEHKEAAAVAAAAGRQSKPSSPGLPGSVHIEVFEILP